jgi:protein SCO1/2
VTKKAIIKYLFVGLTVLLTITTTLGACTAKVELPLLGKAADFALINQDNLGVRLSDFRGKVVVMNFTYTTCPDECGVLSHKLKAARDGLEEGRKQDFVIISVSFDPEVDTPEVLKQYAFEQGFDVPGWQFLTGTQTQIRQVADNYGAQYELLEDSHTDNAPDEHDHRFSHNFVTIVIDQDGEVRQAYGHNFFTVTELRDAITSLLG